jgi:hypothetical protein
VTSVEQSVPQGVCQGETQQLIQSKAVGASIGSRSRGIIPYTPGTQSGVNQGALGETPAGSDIRERSTEGANKRGVGLPRCHRHACIAT